MGGAWVPQALECGGKRSSVQGWVGRNAGGEILFSSTPDIPKLEKGVDGISEQRDDPNLPDEHG